MEVPERQGGQRVEPPEGGVEREQGDSTQELEGEGLQGALGQKGVLGQKAALGQVVVLAQGTWRLLARARERISAGGEQPRGQRARAVVAGGERGPPAAP